MNGAHNAWDVDVRRNAAIGGRGASFDAQQPLVRWLFHSAIDDTV